MGVFVDSNVLVYSVDAGEPVKSAAAQAWLARVWPMGLGRLSTQVLNEFYWAATRKIAARIEHGRARQIVRDYESWVGAPIDSATFEAAWAIESRYGVAWWDALIVAAAQRAECRVLLTEDLQDGQMFGDLRVVDPFRHPPDEILGGDGAGQVSEDAPAARPRRRATRRSRPTSPAPR